MTKREWIIALIEITNLQKAALERAEVEEFITLMDKRQEVLEQIEVLHETYPELREQREPDLVEELRTLDYKNCIEFEKQFKEVKENLRKARQMKKREVHYNNPYDISWEEGVFFDKKEKR